MLNFRFSKRFGVHKKKQILPPADIPPAPVEESASNGREADIINPDAMDESFDLPVRLYILINLEKEGKSI